MSMTAAEREALRRRISERRLAIAATAAPDCPRGFGNASGYRKGCRCDQCRIATNEERVDRRRRSRRGETVPRPAWTRESALDAVAAFSAERGYQPVSDEAGPRHGLPSFASAKRLFGSWNAMIEAAGFRAYPAQSSDEAKTLAYRDRNPRPGTFDGLRSVA